MAGTKCGLKGVFKVRPKAKDRGPVQRLKIGFSYDPMGKPKILCLPEGTNLESLRKIFMKVGLVFTDNLEQIQSVYCKVLAIL
ncbi:MAG: hypothetical protein JRF50_04545 [Deltaproteobacteria bacterium]|nr:hypothetical protein [Deltaproteobacteria bacterium]